MTFSSTSRYVDAPIFNVEDARRGHEQMVGFVYTVAPISRFRLYQVQAGDRWDDIALTVLGDPQLWWKIADINPELFDPRALRPGILIRLP